jgi:putative hydrolase of the HAD superfamily
VIQHISFDLWQTLIRSHPNFKKLRTVLLMTHFDLKQGLEVVHATTQKWDIFFCQMNERTGGNILNFEMVYLILNDLGCEMESVTQEKLQSFFDKMEALFWENQPLLIDENIVEVFAKWREKDITLSILSNTGFIRGNILRRYLQEKGMDDLLHFQLYSDELGVSKPNKKIFEHVYTFVSQFKSIGKQGILHVGDNPIADVKGAENYGLKSFLVAANQTNLSEIFLNYKNQ